MNRKASKLTACIIFYCLLIFNSNYLAAGETREPIFKDGDKVCFVGNSITNNSQFYNFVNLFYATRYPERKVTFINCGISGDVTQGVINRMETDILIHKPTWSVLMIGMNDVSRGLYAKSRANEPGIEEKKKQALEVYRKNLEVIVPKLLENGRKLILQKPSIYDQTGDLVTENLFGVNDALKKCANYAQELADKYHLPTVDYWTILTELNKTLQQKDPKATIIGPDRVHPGPPGHLVMAYEFLKSTGAAEYVSKIVIDKKKNNQSSVQCEIKDISFKKNVIQFSVKESALPFPIDTAAASALTLVSFTNDFNKEILQVHGVSKGNYQLSIDNTDIGVYSSDELKNGINLALVKTTPQYRQAEKIMDLYSEYRKTQLMYRNIVTIQIHQLPDSLKNAPMPVMEAFLNKRLEEKYASSTQYGYYKGQFKSYLLNKAREKEIRNALPEIVEKVYQTNKPTFHSYKLVKK